MPPEQFTNELNNSQARLIPDKEFPKVLVVDDELMNIEVAKAMLENQNVICDTAISGKGALQLIEKRISKLLEENVAMYKLVIIDYNMPHMDGSQVALEIRQRLEKIGIEIPFICCCTADAMTSDLNENKMVLGMDRLIDKPFSYE